VQHCSRTQATVALSSTEAETYALCTALSESLFLQQLLTEAKIATTASIKLFTDSTGAKATAARTGLSSKLKHMQLRYLWIQSALTEPNIKLNKIPTADNLADILTKHATPATLSQLLPRVQLQDTVTMTICAVDCVTDVTDFV
jgi:hypothetical protein